MNKHIIKTITLALTIGTLSGGTMHALSDRDMREFDRFMHDVNKDGLDLLNNMPIGTATITAGIAMGTVAVVAVPLTSYAIGKKVSQYIKKSRYLKAAGLYGAALLTAFSLDKINENTFNDNLPGKLLSSLALGGVSVSLKVIPTIMAFNQILKKTLRLEQEETAGKTPA